MALDAQQNWNVSMAENLDKSLRGKTVHIERQLPILTKSVGNDSTKNAKRKVTKPSWITPPVHLPDEVLLQILNYVSDSDGFQTTLASCCLLSRQWYSAAVPLLYAKPALYGWRFDPFVRAICPSINLHVRKSPLSELVRVLDLSGLIHQSSPRVTARLLGRTKNNLEAFVAPQASFAINSFPALSKCGRLRHLDLSRVFESPPLLDLLKTVSRLDNLAVFRLPRSSGFGGEIDPSLVVWPPRLEDLSLSGGIDANFLHGVVALPSTLRSLTIEHCPLAKSHSLMHLLRTAVRPLPNLVSLKMAYLRQLGSGALDNVLFVLPGLTKLSVSVDYLTPALFDFDARSRGATFESLQTACEVLPPVTRHQWLRGKPHKLQTLELTNSGSPGVEDTITPIDIMIAIDEGSLPDLRQVRVAKSLQWQSGSTAADVNALVDALHESSIEEGGIHGLETGVWVFDGP